MKIHQLAIEDALATLHSAREGLASSEAQRRLHEFGPNRVERIEGEPLFKRICRSFTHFFALILWCAAALAFFAEWREPGQGMDVLGWAILAVILANSLFSFWQENRAERAIHALRRLLPQRVKVLRDKGLVQVALEQIVPGDIVVLEQGDDVPADCRVIEAFGLKVNAATVTGESLGQARDAEPSADEGPLESRNILLAGTSVVAGEAKAVAYATGMHTEFGRIAQLTQAAQQMPSPLQNEIVHLSRLIALFATLLGVAFFFIGQALGLSFWQNLMFAIGIIVANVPEGLLPTVTLSLAMATQRMARKNVLIRHLPAVETLGCTTVILSDKTGTLTQNRMTTGKLFLGGKFHDLAAERPPQEIAAAHQYFFDAAWLCHSLKESGSGAQRTLLGDPTEAALVEMAARFAPRSYPRVDEIPFDSARMRLSVLHRTGQGLTLYTKGALEAVLPLCERVQAGDAAVSLDSGWRSEFLRAEEAMAEHGLRVLAFAYRRVPEGCPRDAFEQGLTLAGLAGLKDPPRPEVKAAIEKCSEAGIRVIMVTGDHPRTALAVAREIGLVKSERPLVITGPELARLSDSQLQFALRAPEILFARLRADQKLRIVSALKRRGEIVAVTGDGVNDAPALKRADIGVAMGITGTDVAKESADMILLDDNFASIVSAIEEGRTVFDNIRKFLTYVLTSNIPEIVPYLAFVLFRIPLPLTIIQILAVDLGTDMLPALALGAERPDPKVMQRPPRSRSERLINWPLIARAYLFLGPLEALAAMAAFFFVLLTGEWHYGQALSISESLYREATTACLSAIIVMQVVNVFLCRSAVNSVFSRPFFDNPIILWGVLAELTLILAIDYTALGNLLFGTAPIGFEVWLFAVPFAAAMLALEELRKSLVRRGGAISKQDRHRHYGAKTA